MRYLRKGYFFQAIILLQPTSPLREKEDYINLIKKFDKSIDMVVSVRESRENPYYFLYEETPNGYLKKSEIFVSRESRILQRFIV